MGGGILKNNNLKSSQNNDVLSFTKTLQNQKNIKNQDIKNLKDIKNSILNFFAFSLIELSIVLIIIGLLVAGITGGASLVRSAKVRAFMNELSGYKQAVYTFYASKGRLPGDLNNLGKIGTNSGQTYTTSSFPAPYNVKEPNQFSAPFIDLYLEKIIDFKPSETNPAGGAGIGYPYSKIYKKSYCFFTNYISSSYGSYYYLTATKINSPYLYLNINSADRPNTASDFKMVDQKMDDGAYNGGSVRALCYASGKNWNATYDEAINDKNNTEQCQHLVYHVGF